MRSFKAQQSPVIQEILSGAGGFSVTSQRTSVTNTVCLSWGHPRSFPPGRAQVGIYGRKKGQFPFPAGSGDSCKPQPGIQPTCFGSH